MTDEKYVLLTDCREKKRTASGAFHKRTHAGKGGAVKFPSDYLTRKELNAMNGEPKSYNLNSPMTWEEYKAMPNDIQIMYIKLLREKFCVPDSKIGEMLGANKDQISLRFKKLGLNGGSTRKRKGWDSDGFYKWMNGIRDPKVEEPAVITNSIENINIPVPTGEPEDDDLTTDVPCVVTAQEKEVENKSVKSVVPEMGQLDFECNAKAALQVVDQILQDACVKMTVVWKRLGDGVQNG